VRKSLLAAVAALALTGGVAQAESAKLSSWSDPHGWTLFDDRALPEGAPYRERAIEQRNYAVEDMKRWRELSRKIGYALACGILDDVDILERVDIGLPEMDEITIRFPNLSKDLGMHQSRGVDYGKAMAAKPNGCDWWRQHPEEAAKMHARVKRDHEYIQVICPNGTSISECYRDFPSRRWIARRELLLEAYDAKHEVILPPGETKDTIQVGGIAGNGKRRDGVGRPFYRPALRTIELILDWAAGQPRDLEVLRLKRVARRLVAVETNQEGAWNLSVRSLRPVLVENIEQGELTVTGFSAGHRPSSHSSTTRGVPAAPARCRLKTTAWPG